MKADWQGLSECRILVVEDNQMNRVLVLGFLKATGVIHIEQAVDGLDGLEKVEAFNPDLIILDLMMPRMDGHEFLRRLRADPRHAELPVLVTTALSSVHDRNEVFSLGATDYLEKPINGLELLARVKVHLRNRVMLNSLTRYRDRLSQDLATLRTMQEMLLPQPAQIDALAASHGIAIDSFFEPSLELGGDLWGCRALAGGKLAVFIADFSGHGVTAAVNTFRLKVLLDGMEQADDPAAVLGILNRALAGMLPRGQFATMAYAVVDTAADTLTFASAGAPPLIAGDVHGVEPCVSRGLPLGVAAGAGYANVTVAFPKGRFLVLYSDALIEMPDRHGKVLEEEGAVTLVAGIRHHTPPLPALLEAFRPNAALDDDLTVVWLRR